MMTMMMPHSHPPPVFFFFFFFFSFCLCVLGMLFSSCITTEAVTKMPNNETTPAVLMFGDSIVDTGNNNNLNSIMKCDFPPYGRDFEGGKPTGRFSNGKVPSDLLVEKLGIKDLMPPYMDPTLQPKDLLTGVSFASGGAGYDPLTSKLMSVIELSTQLEQFKEYIEKLKGIIGEERTGDMLSRSAAIVVAGSNDISNTYFDFHVRSLQYTVPSYTDFLANAASDFVQELYKLGLRRIGVFGAPPLGCLPSSITLTGGIQRKCADIYNQASKMFNSKLSAKLDSLQHKYSDARFVYVDIYNPMLDLINHHENYGFEIVNKGCCGTGTLEALMLCNQMTPNTCTNVSSYLFWDSYHPTEKAYRILVSKIFNKYENSFF